MKLNENIHLWLKSSQALVGSSGDLQQVLTWIEEQKNKVQVKIEVVPFSKMKSWAFDEKYENLRHISGKFFSIDGIKVRTNWGHVENWQQPIIVQSEIGYLGLITREFNGAMEFLIQAKVEPGNINSVQLSPTLQATRSNYTQVHKGKTPPYLELFLNVNPSNIVVDQLQSEQGARFLRKRNRNIVIKTNQEIKLLDNFIWLTLGQIQCLMQYNNLINMDTRTVISAINFGQFDAKEDLDKLISDAPGFKDEIRKIFFKSCISDSEKDGISRILHFITNIKSKYEVFVDKIPLNSVKDWQISDTEISRQDQKFFQVIGVDIYIGGREVNSWQQPMIRASQDGLCGFICKKINGTIYFLVQAKMECGCRDIFEFAPTVQCLTGDYTSPDSSPVPYINYFINANINQIIYDTWQSEEGGRFFREKNKNMIIIVDDTFSEKTPENFIWMNLYQLSYFIRFNNFINIQARSLISAVI